MLNLILIYGRTVIREKKLEIRQFGNYFLPQLIPENPLRTKKRKNRFRKSGSTIDPVFLIREIAENNMILVEFSNRRITSINLTRTVIHFSIRMNKIISFVKTISTRLPH